MSVHVEPSAQSRANRRIAGRKAAETKKRNAARRRQLLADMAPGSPHIGSAPVDGDIGAILARIRAHQAKGAKA